ncbi:hypothetical protein AB0D97_30150 [Streptomyces roseus]|uniref:hypothetical protein n=1 Tax=Streptomyces roseus TaxID=66430 RepID=UPI0033C2A39A
MTRRWRGTSKSSSEPGIRYVAQRVVQQVGSPKIDETLRTYEVRTRFGDFQNLIFPGDGGPDSKPEIVLVDATSNRIQITKNKQFWLVYDQPLLHCGCPGRR